MLDRIVAKIEQEIIENGHPVTYKRVITLKDRDFYSKMHTYCETCFYRNTQLLNCSEDGNYDRIRVYLAKVGVVDYALV